MRADRVDHDERCHRGRGLGGPLYDAQGHVVGIDTTAQTSGRSGQTVAGYAIPIGRHHGRLDHHGSQRQRDLQPAELTTTPAAHDPGARVSVTWIDASGTSHTATVTLGSGPAD